MQKKSFVYSVGCCLALLLFVSANSIVRTQTSLGNHLEIKFSHYVGDKMLSLDTAFYKNELNQNFSVTKFKYYIGNVTLAKKNGAIYKCEKYFLIDEEKSNSKTILLENIPASEYVSISFTIGVDSIDNCSGAQTGALDPINGMFWTWNTGYIFMKLEGISESSTAPNAMFEYHIGGYKKPHNCIRKVSLPLDKSIFVSSQHKENIEIKTDVLEILKMPKTVDFSTLSSVTDFNNSTTIADNYTDMFSIIKSGNEK